MTSRALDWLKEAAAWALHEAATVLQLTGRWVKINIRLLIEVIGVAGVIVTAVGVWLQYTQFREEIFTRKVAGLTQAWAILSSAGGTKYDMGQRDALEFLASQGRLEGHLRLDKLDISGINLEGRIPPENFNFKYSSLCQSTIFVSELRKADFRYSVLGGVAISAILDDALFDGAFMQKMHFLTGRADRTVFVAADLQNTTFRGGSFVGSNFDGADMRGSQFVALKNYDEKEVAEKRESARRSPLDREAPHDAYLLNNDEYYVSDAKPVSEEQLMSKGPASIGLISGAPT